MQMDNKNNSEIFDDFGVPDYSSESSDEEEDEVGERIGEFTHINPTKVNVKVSFNFTKKIRLIKAVKEIKITCAKVRNLLGLSNTAKPTPNQVLNLFIPNSFCVKLLSGINRAFKAEDWLNLHHLQEAFVILFWIHFYGCSYTKFFDTKCRIAYPMAEKLSLINFKKVMKGLSYDINNLNLASSSWTKVNSFDTRI